MIYMLVAVPGSPPAASGQPMPMPGMAGGYAGAGSSLRAVAVVLAFFMVGYVLGQPTSSHPYRAPPPPYRPRPQSQNQPCSRPPAAPRLPRPHRTRPPRAHPALPWPGATTMLAPPALAPRLAACYKIVMGLTMGYMLIIML